MTGRRRAALALVAGAAAGLGHAPFGLWPVALAGFAVLIRLVAGPRGALPHTPGYLQTGERAGRRAALTAWAGGLGYFAVSLHWIVEPFLVDAARHGWMAPFALVLMAGGLALFWGLAGWGSARMRWPAFGFALALALAEMARGYLFTGFPWALPAYVWVETPVRGMAAVFGSYGLTAATLGLAALPSLSARFWPGALVALAGAGAMAFFGYELPLKQSYAGTVRLVQPNAPQDEKWDPAKAHDFVERAIGFTSAPGAPDLIVWPETAIPYPLDIAAPVLDRIAAAAGDVPVISGINRRAASGDWFNAAVVIAPDGRVAETYDKVHLVPFGEYIPFRIGFLQAMAGFSNFGFSAGDEVRLIETPLGRALPLICYEAIFPQHGAAAGRPDYLLQITNDAWFGTFSGPYQHLDQARFRAVEQGLPLIRAANTGVSAVIDPDGRVLWSLALGEAGYLDAPLPTPRAPTVYARTGDWPVAIILLLSLGALILAAPRNGIAKRRGNA